MPRLGTIEKEEVKSIILVCKARGYNYKQILSVVNDNLRKHNISISEKAIFNILAKTKKDAQEWLKNLSVGKDDYIDEYRQRIMELNEQRRDLWEIVRKYEKQPFVQISAHKEIHALTKSILQLYETLPLLVTNSKIPNGAFVILSTKIRLVNIPIFLHDLIIYILAMIVFYLVFFSSNDLYGCIDLQRISDMVCLRHTIETKQS